MSASIEKVIRGGYCIGCGICAVPEGSPISIGMSTFGEHQAKIEKGADPQSLDLLSKICPFSDSAPNEDQIAEKHFEKGFQKDRYIGNYLSTYVGYVKEGCYRDSGSSGGMGSWILADLLSGGIVDYVIHVKPNSPSPNSAELFSYSISKTAGEVKAGSKSRYYPVEMSGVLRHVKANPGRYAIVGIPCFIKAVRLLMLTDQCINSRVKFCIGLVCGHLKGEYFSKLLAWQCGVPPQDIQSVDFRKKIENMPANKYAFSVKAADGREITKPMDELYGGDWGLGLFKYKACDYCDDVVAETADVTIGDAWLPEFTEDWQGTNIIVVRSREIDLQLRNAHQRNRIHLQAVTAEDIFRSQEGGFSHRREGLQYRLQLALATSKWCPPKRVNPSNKFSNQFKKKHRLRMELSSQSKYLFRNALEKNSLDFFMISMEKLVKVYRKNLYKKTLGQRIISKIRNFIKGIL